MRASFFVGAGLFLVAVTGCGDGGTTGVVTPVPVAAADGSVVVDFTVDGVKDPAECQQGGATTIDITVQTMDGAPAGEFQADCGAFSTSIDLPPDRYTATAELVDAGGNPRTTAIDIQPFTIHDSEVLTIPIEFPASSFE
jgi:hypothetical protein